MSYATVDDLKTRHGQDIEHLLDRDADGQDDADVGETALADATAEIDSILGARYSVPIQGAPWLTVACCDVARFRLYDDAVPETVKDRYEFTIERLRAIAKGSGALLDEAGQPISERQDEHQAGGATSKMPRKRVFTDENLSGYLS